MPPTSASLNLQVQKCIAVPGGSINTLLRLNLLSVEASASDKVFGQTFDA